MRTMRSAWSSDTAGLHLHTSGFGPDAETQQKKTGQTPSVGAWLIQRYKSETVLQRIAEARRSHHTEASEEHRRCFVSEQLHLSSKGMHERFPGRRVRSRKLLQTRSQ